MHEILGVIPAKGYSARIPGKNLIDLGGKPLLQWTIEAARTSVLSRIIVSTDDAEISTYAAGFGIEVMQRYSPLAAPLVHAVHVVLDVLQQCYVANEYVPDAVMMLLPTSPFRTADHIDDAIALWSAKTCEAVIGVKQLPHHLINERTINEAGCLRPITQAPLDVNQQELEPLYAVTGAIFLAAERVLLRDRSFHRSDWAIPYVMNGLSCLEIDTPADLETARRLCRHQSHPPPISPEVLYA